MSEPLSIVVGEDEALIRLDLSEMLVELGYNVVGQAGDGEAAVRLVSALAPNIALLDVKMPVLDGLSAAEQISQLGTTAVVMLTAFSSPEFVERATQAGVMGYLVKPVNQSDLRPALELARTRFAEQVSLTAEIGQLTQQLETRKLVERAKGVLQQQYGLDEAASFRWLQKAAMDRRLSMAAVAGVVIAESTAQKLDQSLPDADR